MAAEGCIRRIRMANGEFLVLIVEDDADARMRMARAVSRQHDMKLQAAVGSLMEANEALDDAWPNILLVDLGLPDGDGSSLIERVAADRRKCEIMVVTVFGDEKHVLRAIEAGASGYLLKEEDDEQIGRCIRQLAAGGSPMTPSIARHLLNRYRNGDGDSSPDVDRASARPALTGREVEVLSLIAKGYNFNEIADLIGVTYHTVTSHVRNIYGKLSVHSRSEAVFEAVQRGLVRIGA